MSEEMNKEVKEEVKEAEIKMVGDPEKALRPVPTDIWLQFNTITVGVGDKKKTFDLVKIFEGLEKLNK